MCTVNIFDNHRRRHIYHNNRKTAEELITTAHALLGLLVPERTESVRVATIKVSGKIVMEKEQSRPSHKVLEKRKRPKRDGYKICGECNGSVGLRAKQCTHCNSSFPSKVKDWESIQKHASTMKDSYIKDKLFDRIDQLATKPGWTGIVFLVHENPESRAGQKRIFHHSYSTKGAGRKIEDAMRAKVFKAMKSFLHGDANEQQYEKENLTGGEEDASSEVDMTVTASSTSVPLESSNSITSGASPRTSSTSSTFSSLSSGDPNLSSVVCPFVSSTPSLASSSAAPPFHNSTAVIPQSSVSVSSYPGSYFPSSTAISLPSAIPSLPPASIANRAPSPTVSPPHSSSTASHPASASESALQSVNTIASSSASHIRSQSFCFSQPSNISNNSNASSSNPSSSIVASNSNASNASSTAASFGTSISSRHGRIMEINGMKFFVINSKK